MAPAKGLFHGVLSLLPLLNFLYIHSLMILYPSHQNQINYGSQGISYCG